jgi:hypothetical protein
MRENGSHKSRLADLQAGAWKSQKECPPAMGYEFERRPPSPGGAKDPALTAILRRHPLPQPMNNALMPFPSAVISLAPCGARAPVARGPLSSPAALPAAWAFAAPRVRAKYVLWGLGLPCPRPNAVRLGGDYQHHPGARRATQTAARWEGLSVGRRTGQRTFRYMFAYGRFANRRSELARELAVSPTASYR